MPYAAQETSQESGQPIELFDFRIGVESFLYTTDPDPVTYNALTYQPFEIERTNLNFSAEQRNETLQINVPSTEPLVRKFVNSVPGQRATLTIRRVHRNDGANEVIELWKGTVRTVGFDQNGVRANIAVLPLTSELADSIPRFKYSAVCNHVLYDQACTVAQSLFRHQNEVTGVAGDTITVQGLAAKGSGWANGGFIALPTGDFRLVNSHTGDTIRVLKPFPSSPLGLTVEVFAGCDHSINTCSSKFNNVQNFGGFAWVPLRNVFSTGLK